LSLLRPSACRGARTPFEDESALSKFRDECCAEGPAVSVVQLWCWPSARGRLPCGNGTTDQWRYGQRAARSSLWLQLSLSEVLKPTVTAPPLRVRLTRQRNALIHVWEKTRETGRYRLPLERNKPRPGQDMLDPASHNRRLEELWHLLKHRRSSVRVKAAQSFCLTPQQRSAPKKKARRDRCSVVLGAARSLGEVGITFMLGAKTSSAERT